MDQELTGALTRPDLELVRCESELVALGELCKAARQGGNQGAPKGGGLILLLVEPKKITLAASLVRAAERYAARAACWMFDPAQSPRLRSVQPTDVESWIEHAAPSEGTDERPTLRLADRPEEPQGQITPDQDPPLVVTKGKARETMGSGSVRQAAQDGEAGGILTTEELAMLLADDHESKHN